MRRLAIGFLAAAAVTAPLITTTAASASTDVTRPVVFSAEQAGAAIGAPRVHYRYVQTTFTLPNSSKLPYTSGGGISIQLRSPGEIFVLGISAVPGSQWNAAAVDVQPGSCTSGGCIVYTNANSPVMDAGDSITLSAYYNTSTVPHGHGRVLTSRPDLRSGRYLPAHPLWVRTACGRGREAAERPAGRVRLEGGAGR